METNFFSIFSESFFRLVYNYFSINPSFWPVEIDFLVSENHFVPISQIFNLLKAILPFLKQILYYSQRQQIFYLVETIFFHSHFFLETIIVIRRRPIFLKNIFISASRNRFFPFFQMIRMELAFRSSEIAFFKESFILASGNGFSINYKLCVFIRSFFCW